MSGGLPGMLGDCGSPYFDTAANSGECINDWNSLSSLLKCISRFELSESTVTPSILSLIHI